MERSGIFRDIKSRKESRKRRAHLTHQNDEAPALDTPGLVSKMVLSVEP